MPLISKVGRKQPKVRLILLSITLFLWIGVFLHLFPIWWMFITSIKPPQELYTGISLFPRQPSLAGYKLIFSSAFYWWAAPYPFHVYIKNSLIITASIMAFQVITTCLVGYALSKLIPARWSRLLFIFFVGTMFVPMQASLIPLFLLMRNFPFAFAQIPKIPFTNIDFPHLNFVNTYWGVIFPVSFSPFYVLLFKGFFDGIPSEIINAARIDGARESSIFRRIVMPLSKPIFAVITYFSFSGAWNSFLWPLLMFNDDSKYPLPLVIYRMQAALSQHILGRERPWLSQEALAGYGMNGLMALAILESIPVFIMFIIFREQLMKGIKLRGFK